MDYVELDLSSELAAYAADASYTARDWPMFNLGQRIQGIQAIKVVEVSIPKTWNNWVDTFDTDTTAFYSTSTLNYFFLEIPAGSYTVETFIETVEALMAAPAFQADLVAETGVNGPITCELNYDYPTQTFSFHFYGDPGDIGTGDLTVLQWFMYYSNQPNNYFIGFNGQGLTPMIGTPDDVTLTMPLRARVNWPNYIQVGSNTVGDICKAYKPLSLEPTTDQFGITGAIGNSGQSSPQFAAIPNDKQFGETIIWQDPNPTRYFSLNSLFQLSTIDIFLTNGPFNTPLRLNGNSFFVKIGLLVDKSASIQ